jgi:hypothetical protein
MAKKKKRFLCIGGPFDRQYREAAEMEGTMRWDSPTQTYVVDTPGHDYVRFNAGSSPTFYGMHPQSMILVHRSLL